MTNEKSPMGFNPITTAISILTFAVVLALALHFISPPAPAHSCGEDETEESGE
ncbi:MAG: hypothetical protein NTX03_15000 [Bacteroidetes bacterium]|nr:hypothetical protein [Bacteroidota bacterium]